MTINRDCLDKTYGPIDTEIDASSIEAYADATLDPLILYRSHDPVAPPVFGIVPIWPAVQDALADEELGIDIGRVVHGEQRMTFHRMICAGDKLRGVGRISSIAERGPNEILVLSFETHDEAGTLVTAQDIVCVSRGTARGSRSSDPAEKKNRAAQQDFTEEPYLVREVWLPADITFRYAKASGDDNRIHIDGDFARQMGLPGIIVQGMCLFSIAVQAVIAGPCRDDPRRLRSASVRFTRPLGPDHAFEVSVFELPDRFSYEGRGPGAETILIGNAQLAQAEAGT